MNTNSASAFDQQPLNITPSDSPLSVAPQLAFVSRSSSLLFVDSSVSDYKTLVAGSAPGTEVHVLNSSEDAVTQITNTLLGRSGISSLHILSHGEAGGLDFGSNALNLTDLPQYAAQLKTWSKALTNDADILLYGCNVAAGEVGQTFVKNISQLTGADVAASNNLTGKDGDWNLEVTTGKIESSLVFNSSVTAAYAYDLNILGETFTGNNVTNPSWIYNTTGTQPSLTARSTAAASTGGIPGGGSDAVGTGALRLTSVAGNQASFVIYNRPINASSGLSITFNIHAYGGSGADGISFFLIDGNASPTVVGASGGALGYAYSQSGNASQGLAGGYLGIGLDEFGNFSSVGYGSGGIGQTPDSIAVRGSAANSYKYLTGTGTLPPSPGIDQPGVGGTRSNSEKAVQIDLTPAGLLSVKIDLNNDGVFSGTNEIPTALQNYNVTASNGALPSTFKFGFSASTGGSTNVHEITGLNVDTFGGVPYTPLVNFTSSSGSISEGAASINLTAQIDVATSSTVTVPVTLSGTAANGTDYTLSNNIITIAAGQLTGSIALNPIDNLVVGSNKTAVVTMGTPTGAQLSPQNNVFTATIVDNDYSIAASGSSTYTENGSPVLISPTAAITGDLTASAINSATVSIGSGFSSAEDRLGIQGQSGTSGTISSTSITWSYDTTSGILTLSGTDTGANYQAALRQVVYRDLSDAPNTITRAVAYTLNYNSSQQATSSSSPSIAITPVNDAPTVAAPATIAVIARTQTALTGITFADVDAGSGTVTATLTVGAGTLAATSGSGVTVGGTATNLTLSGTLAAINSFIAGSSLTYTTPSTSITTQTLGVSLSDGGNTGTGGTLNSGVTNVTLSTAVSFVKNDFNGDGKSDILWRNPSTGQVAIWQMDGTTLQAGTGFISANPGLDWQIAGTGDFNGDKKADILWRNSFTGQAAIWEMDGTTLLAGTGFISANPGTGWQIGGTGDFNGDAKADILWRNSSTGQLAIWEMDGTTLLAGTGFISANPGASWQISGTGDFNGDGKADILWNNSSSNQTAIWLMDGLTLLPGTGFISAIAPSGWKIARTVNGTDDANGDGLSDIFWYNTTTNQTAVWEMSGTTLLPGTGFISAIAPSGWVIEDSGDYNGDARIDLLWRNQTSNQIAVWELDGTVLQPGTGFVSQIAPSVWQVAA